MSGVIPSLNYPEGLPVVARRADIVETIKKNEVTVVVSETGSGKTTQLPKLVIEALTGTGVRGIIGCTQPRRIAAASVSERVAEELKVPLGGFVGYQVRFEDRTGPATRVKFMTDGILLAETQSDPNLQNYAAIIIDEAHERSLNIDFLLGYLKRLLESGRKLKVIISSATLDAGGFVDFFTSDDCAGDQSRIGVGLIEAEGRTFPVEEVYMPSADDEDIVDEVVRAVDWLEDTGERGDVLVFLPGEREIRDCAEMLEGRRYRGTEVLPLFARLSIGDQQRVFHPGSKRRIVLATNVAETSLTIPRISCVVDSGLARVNRWSPARGVQRLQIEEISQASARQRKGRCGRISEGICIRLYSEENLELRPEYTDPEIRRSSLAGVILRMKLLGLPEINEFPFLDPPSPKAVSDGYRTLRELGAVGKNQAITERGREMARLPVDPRLARMLIEAKMRNTLASVLPVVALLELQDPRERPQEKQQEADKAQACWRNDQSDFLGIFAMWCGLQKLRKGRGWQANQLRKLCRERFLNFRRVLEWGNVVEELQRTCNESLGTIKDQSRGDRQSVADLDPIAFHCALLSGVPRQFGLWDKESKSYRGANGVSFQIFPGSGLFGGKKIDWVLAMELVETTRLWARRVARIDPAWVEQVAPHLCRSRYGEGQWDPAQGAVYAKETVICGGLPIIANRRVHFGRIDPRGARNIFIREALLQNGVKGRSKIGERLVELREEVELVEHKLRRRGGLWSEESLIEYFESRLPMEMSTAKAWHKWRALHEDDNLPERADVVLEDLEELDYSGFPDFLNLSGVSYAVYYRCDPAARDNGVTLGIHIEQLPSTPDWIASWGVPGDLHARAEWLIRSLPKDLRRECQPVAERAADFASNWRDREKDGPCEVRLANNLSDTSGWEIKPDDFDLERLPDEYVTKIWVCDDEGEELGFGQDMLELKRQLGAVVKERIESAANDDWETSGWMSWPDFEVPPQVNGSSGVIYPSLVDEGSSVGTRAFLLQAEAAQSHRLGVTRLLLITTPEQIAYLRKNHQLDIATKLDLSRSGNDLEDLIRLAAEGALGLERISNAEDFENRVKTAVGELWKTSTKIAAAIDSGVKHSAKVRDWISSNQEDRNLGEITADLEEELMWLFRTRYVWRSGFQNILNYDRYGKAIISRIGRLTSLPLFKDLEKMDRVREFWSPWFKEWTAKPEDPALWDYGWKLEEFRVALFAPDVVGGMKISEKILAGGW